MKYKFRLLIAMMLICLSSFSQTDIKVQQVPNNDTVKLHVEVAKKVVKDLLYLDAVKKERILLLENIDTLQSQKALKDKIIGLKDVEIKFYKEIITAHEDKEKAYNAAITSLNSDLKKQKLSKKISLGLVLLAVGFSVLK